MKAIKIKTFSIVPNTYTVRYENGKTKTFLSKKNANKYRVALGNKLSRDFENLKLAKKFLCETNRFLNLKLHEAVFIFSDLQLQFRRNWFYFDHHKRPGAALYSNERRCKEHLRSVENAFDIMVERSHFENGNHFVFAHFGNIFNRMKETMKILQQLQKTKSSSVDIHKLEVLYRRILQVEKELFEYSGQFEKEVIDFESIFNRNGMQLVK